MCPSGKGNEVTNKCDGIKFNKEGCAHLGTENEKQQNKGKQMCLVVFCGGGRLGRSEWTTNTM